MTTTATVTATPTGRLELVHSFSRPMPTGASVSESGRIFVNYPRWGDDVPATVTEIRDGQAVPYPDLEWNTRPATATGPPSSRCRAS